MVIFVFEILCHSMLLIISMLSRPIQINAASTEIHGATCAGFDSRLECAGQSSPCMLGDPVDDNAPPNTFALYSLQLALV